MKQRTEEIDFLKCLFILLMIIFHLRYIGDSYPYAKQLVYTFHMPAFLLISGYLMNVWKNTGAFVRGMLWIFIPYAVMESAYTLMSALLPVRERVEALSLTFWADKLLFHPLGPYWYLHTLLICGGTYYALYRIPRLSGRTLTFIIVLALCYRGWAEAGILSFSNALYFSAGVLLRQSRTTFTAFFRPSLLSVVPFVGLAFFPANLDKSSVGGIFITYLAISLGLTLFRYSTASVRRIGCYIGAHTFIILVFSPIFTMAVKPLVGLLSFEPSGMLFLLVALTLTLSGCFLTAWLLDRFGLSPYFWGKSQMLQPFSRGDKLTAP